MMYRNNQATGEDYPRAIVTQRSLCPTTAAWSVCSGRNASLRFGTVTDAMSALESRIAFGTDLLDAKKLAVH